MTTPLPSAATTTGPVRVDGLRAVLVDIFQDLSGLSLSECDPSVTFLELGFDSLFLTQATQAIYSRFGLRVAFRQLLDQLSSLNALAAYLDAKLPAGAFPAEPVRAPQIGTTSSAPPAEYRNVSEGSPSVAGQSGMEGILRDLVQVISQLMSKQLEIARGSSPATIATSNAAQAPGSSAPAKQAVPADESAKPAATQEFKAFRPIKPIQRGPVGGLTERQSRYLDSFINRYTAKTPGSKEAAQSCRRFLADPRAAAGFRAQWKEMVYPLVTVRSQGSKLWDVDGNEYIDIVSGFGPIFFGHAPSFVVEAIAAQLKDGYEIGPQTPLAGEVAKLVCELTGNERATFCNTGSEAVMAAMRVRAHRDRTKKDRALLRRLPRDVRRGPLEGDP